MKYKIIFCLIMLANIIGCGVKGNPVIWHNIADDGIIVQNLKAASSDSAVVLQWDFYGKDSKINYIAVEKSEVGSPGNACKDCPRRFERIGQVTMKDVYRETKGHLSFSDNKVTQGKTYNYRLLLCDDFNNCVENATTEINHK